MTRKPLRKKHTQGTGNRCRWFALCNRPATTAVPHPVLGMVPCCDRCAAFALSLIDAVLQSDSEGML
jgi:hypothetical protein